MCRDKSTKESTRIAHYWDDLVTGAPERPGERVSAEIDPTLVQTIAWLERIDDAQPASAEFSRQFERQFLQTVGAAPAHSRPLQEQFAGRLPAIPVHRDHHQGNHRGLPLPAPSHRRHKAGGYGRDSRGWRLQVSFAAAVLLVVSIVAIYYVFERREGPRETNVILAPSIAIDVPMDRGNAERSGVMPGPGITDDLTLSWSFEAGRDGISAPAVVGDTIFVTNWLDPVGVSADQGSVIAIDASTGSERWRFPTEHPTSATPAVAAGIVYAGDAGGNVYALDARTGEQHWRERAAKRMDFGTGGGG